MSSWSPASVFCGTCPICQGGNRRIRCEKMDDGHIELFALCDECEALWLDPALAPEDYYFSDAIEPLCPRSGQPLYGPDSWWATREFVQETPWAIHLPPDAAASGESLPPDSAEDPSPDPPDESA